jgi:hypothetical protein
MNYIIRIFEVTTPNGIICQFGNRCDNVEPLIKENQFVYTYTMNNDPTRYEVSLNENTIGAALQALALYDGEHHITFWWNVPPSVQWDMEDEGWTIEKLLTTTIGDHLDLRMNLVAGPERTLVHTYVAPLAEQDDDIVEEFQMDTPEEVQTWYNPETHSKTGTPFARPWDEQDEADIVARQAANFNHINGIIIEKATELLATRAATSLLN